MHGWRDWDLGGGTKALPGQLDDWRRRRGLPVEDSWDFNKVDDPLEDLRNDKDRLTLIAAAPVPPVEVDVAVRATEWNGA